MAIKTREKIEYGDFQTPLALADKMCRLLKLRGVRPNAIVEPTCGQGSILNSSLSQFPEVERAIGVEINPIHFKFAVDRVRQTKYRTDVDLRLASFFSFDWRKEFASLPEPILIIGNPPWVTASELGAINSKNLPTKSNFQGRSGLDALTGKANFDIAEWMLIHLLESPVAKRTTLAMLVKTSVARKILSHVWSSRLPIKSSCMYTFDAKRYFGVAVDACFLVCDVEPGAISTPVCEVRDLENPDILLRCLAHRNGVLIADIEKYQARKTFEKSNAGHSTLRWRSGVKHDCAQVMELKRVDGDLLNGLGDHVDIEEKYLFPMLKGSEVAKGGNSIGNRFMIVTQHHTGEDTGYIKQQAPKTWRYLTKHIDKLDRRRSSIYRNRPRYSVFGVGPYTFAPWKIAICGLYKKFDFTVVGPYNSRPVVFDDTVYHLSFDFEKDARLVGDLLNSNDVHDFLSAFVFWDAKRPVTVELLKRLSIEAVAKAHGLSMNPFFNTIEARDAAMQLF